MKVAASTNVALMVEPTQVEIYDSLFQMHPIKGPGIDGMHALFYQNFGMLLEMI